MNDTVQSILDTLDGIIPVAQFLATATDWIAENIFGQFPKLLSFVESAIGFLKGLPEKLGGLFKK